MSNDNVNIQENDNVTSEENNTEYTAGYKILRYIVHHYVCKLAGTTNKSSNVTVVDEAISSVAVRAHNTITAHQTPPK